MTGTTSRAAVLLALAAGVLVTTASPALATDGTLDPAFGAGGLTIAELSAGEAEDSASGVAVRGDGSVYVAGTESEGFDRMSTPLLSRLTSSGALDTAFGQGGVVRGPVGYEAQWREVVATADGGAVVLGWGDEQRWTLAKYTASGALDPGFSGDGRVDGPADGQAFALLQQPDGKLVVVGLDCQRFGSNACDHVVVQRLTRAGAPDTTFGAGGTSTLSTGLLSQSVGAALDQTGRVVFAAPGYRNAGAVFGSVVGRLTAGGGLDGTFGGSGLRTFADQDGIDMVAVDSADRPVLVYTDYGSETTSHEVRRLTVSGGDDAGYGTGPNGPLDTSSWVSPALHSVEVLADDTVSIIGSGGSNAGSAGSFSYTRLVGPAGSPDTRLGPAGETVVSLGGTEYSRWVADAVTDAQGRLVVTGSSYEEGSGRTLVGRVRGPGLGPVSGVTVVPAAGALTVSWSAPSSGPAPTGYTVTLSPGGVTRTVTTTSTTFRGLVNGSEYAVTVQPVSGDMAGPVAGPVTGTPNGCASTRFGDVAAAHPFCSQIAWMASNGISTGTVVADGSVEYRPAVAVSRSAMAPFLYRTLGSPQFTPPATATFADVGTDHPFFAQIEWMSVRGISSGTQQPSGKPLYKPTDPVSRQAMAPFLYRASSSPTFTPPSAPTFADVPTSHPFFKEIEWMAATGISTGTPQSSGKPLYKPGDAVSRQAMAAFLNRMADLPG